MTQTNSRKIHNLKQQIAAGRQRLQKLWDARGHTDSGGIPDAEGICDADILAASIELDDLMNRYQKLTS